MILTWLITGGVNLDHLFKVMSPYVLYCKVTIFPLPHTSSLKVSCHVQFTYGGTEIKLHFLEEEEENGNPHSTLAWKILWTEETGSLQSMGSQRVGYDWATSVQFLEEQVSRICGHTFKLQTLLKKILGSYTNILFFLKVLPTNLNILKQILLTALNYYGILTVIFYFLRSFFIYSFAHIMQPAGS